MSGPTTVRLIARALASGFPPKAEPLVCRVTLTLNPGPGNGDRSLADWPALARELRPSLRLGIADPNGASRDAPGSQIAALPLLDCAEVGSDPHPAETLTRILGLWRRVMAPPEDDLPRGKAWMDLWRVIQSTAPAAPPAQHAIATPAHVAGLAFPAERGRALLDALAQPGGAIMARAPARPATGRLAATGEIGEPIRMASLAAQASVASDAPAFPLPGPSGSGLREPHPWPSPPAIVRGAMGQDGGLGRLFDALHAAHMAATPAAVTAPPDDAAFMNAARRLASLQASPVLQRLFGFAVTLDVDFSALPGGLPPEGRFLLLAVCGIDGPPLWTLAKLRPAGAASGHFGPATWEEFDYDTSGGSLPPSREGLETLDRLVGDHPAYELVTVDPELSVEADLGLKREREEARITANQRPTARSGGLRLIDRALLDSLKKTAVARGTAVPAQTAFLDDGQPLVQDAAALHPRSRLDLSLDTAGGAQWRCAMHRIVRYVDPAPGRHPADWIEQELSRLLGPADGAWRIELDAATVVATVATRQAPPKPSVPAPPPKPAVPLPAGMAGQRETDRDSSEAAASVETIIAESTLAAWGGEPMGSTAADSVTSALNDLGITRTASLPSAEAGQAAALLSMPMRFGWPYRVGVRKVYPAGVCVPLAAAAVRYADPETHACLPSPGGKKAQSGRRLLRHERVEPPVLALLAADRKHASKMPAQGAAHAIVRTAPERSLADPRIARRLLAVPGVPLQFTTLHGAFDAWARNSSTHERHPPAGGLTGRLSGAHGQAALLEVSRRPGPKEPPYYPDPAASLMVLAIRRYEEPDGWLDEPLPILLGGRWPDTMPILVELHAADDGSAKRLANGGAGWLGASERLFRSEREARKTGAATPVHVVHATLRPGEEVALDAWCVPSVEQLVAWFDIVETAGLLAAHDGGEPGGRAGETCAASLEALLGLQSQPAPAAGSPAVSPAVSCSGAGGLEAPSPAALRPLGAMTHQAMLRRPARMVAGVQTIRLTHAVAKPQAKPSLEQDGPGRIAVTRRLFPGGDSPDPKRPGETRLDFVGSLRSSEWSESSSQEGAVPAIFGGSIDFDPATTIAVELEIECADPHSDKLDDDQHRRRDPKRRAAGDWTGADPTDRFASLLGFEVHRDRTTAFKPKRALALRIDGLPAPADRRAGVRRFTLEALQAAAWGGGADDAVPAAARAALRVSLADVFGTPGARLLKVTPVAIGRHTGQMQERSGTVPTLAPAEAMLRGDPVEVWLPATRRPAPPVVHDVDVRLERGERKTLEPGGATVTATQSTSIRVRLARPWFSSGEGERLGLVLWPPDVFARGTARDDAGLAIPTALLDPDIGPGGPYVTRWAGQSADAAGASLSQLVPADAFGLPDADPHALVPLAFMPLPTDSPSDSKRAPPPDFAAVALITAEPRFDVTEELWYADFSLKEGLASDPYLRLGLVRYQPHAREDRVPPEGSEPVRLRTSTAATIRAPVLASRKAEATWRTRSDGSVEVYVTARITRPSGNVAGNGPGPAVRVELFRQRKADAQRTTALDSDGELCRWESWRDTGPDPDDQRGGTAWTCRFVLPSAPDDPRWTISALVETFSRRPPATYDNEPVKGGSDKTLVESGPDFIAILPL